MPLLKREPDITPGLFDLDLALHPWRVAHVRSRQEKTLARHCHERGIPFYLPLTQNEVVTRSGPRQHGPSAERAPGCELKEKRTTDNGQRTTLNRRPDTDGRVGHAISQSAIRNSQSRVRTSYAPLFTGYVFLRAAADQRVDALRSNVIVNLLEVTDQFALADELGQIHALQASGAVLVPFPWLTTGDAVRIRDGSFRGYEGVIVKEKGEERLVVSISMIRQSVVVELGRDSIVPERIAVA